MTPLGQLRPNVTEIFLGLSPFENYKEAGDSSLYLFPSLFY